MLHPLVLKHANVRRTSLLAAMTLAAALSGCAGFFTGYDADNQFKCKAPPGVQCQSISGVYANSQGGSAGANLAPQDRRAADSSTGALPLPAARNMGAGQPPTYSGAIRSEPTTIRTWIMSYKDTDGDIVDQTYVYMALDSGHWMIEHAQQLVRDSYAPAKPARAMGTGLPSANTGSVPTRPASEPGNLSPSNTPSSKGQPPAPTNVAAEPSDPQDPAAMVQRIQDATRRATQPGATPPAATDDNVSKPSR